MGKIAKRSKNPFFKSDYADLPTILDAVKNPMAKAGLVLTHMPIGDNNLMTRLMHKSGQWQQGIMHMRAVKDTPQDRGSVITYMTRYATGAYLGLSIDKDDDGNKGTFGKGAPPSKQPTVYSKKPSKAVAPKKVTSTPKPVKKEAEGLKQMTAAVRDVMIEYINKGDIAVVNSKLGTYADGAIKTEVATSLAARIKADKK